MTAFLASLWGLRSAIMNNALIGAFHEQKKSISFYQGRIEWQQKVHKIEIGENHDLS